MTSALPFRILAGSFAGLFSINALAELPAQLEDLVVTALLGPVEREQVTGSVTVFTAEDLERHQVVFLGDLLRLVPGFAVSQSGGPGAQTQMRVRGAEANHVLVLVDGMRVNDPASDDEFQFQYALGSNVERVEIVRGAQSATWGTDALSAVINIIQRKDVHRRGVDIIAETGSWNTRRLDLSASHAAERYGAWGGISSLDTDGINIARVGSERDGTENRTLAAGIDVTLNESLRLDLAARHVEADSDFDDIDFEVTGLPRDADLSTEARRTHLTARLDIEPAGRRWNGVVRLARLDTDNRNFDRGLWTSSTAADILEFKAQASLLLGDSGDPRHRLSIAADRREVEFRQRGEATQFGDPNQDQQSDVTGLAAEFFSRPLDALSWSFSARVDEFSEFETASTWQLAAGYRVRDGLRVRGNLGTGSKAPTFIERFGFFPGSFVGNPGLEPESSSGWELGFDASFAPGDTRLEFAWFDQTLEDEIDGFVYDAASGLFTAANRLTDSERSGFEVALRSALTDRLSLGLSFTKVDASEADFTGLQVPEVRRPERMASLDATYRFAHDRAELSLSMQHNGDRRDLFFSPQTFISEQVVLDRYTVVDLAARWRLRNDLELTARVENLFDEAYEEVLGFSRPGRAVYAGLRYRFEKLE